MMHETIIAGSIMKEAKRHGDVKAITLEIGELAHVPGNELIACLKSLVDWKIVWSEIPAEVKCDCDYAGHPAILERGHDSFIIECPACRGVPELISGTEIKIVDVKVD